jgi:hypothetical protein
VVLEDRCQVIQHRAIRLLGIAPMLANSFLACGQGLGLAVPALQRSLQHLLCLQSSSSSSAAAYASKAKAEPPYKKESSKGASKKKDAADKPPRAVSAYAFFVKEQAAARKGEDGLKAPGLMKRMAGEWNAMQEDEKQPYKAAAEKSKAESAEARAALKSARKSARGPASAYNIFCAEVAAELRSTQQHLKGPDFLRAAAARWAALPVAEKEQRKADALAAKDAWKAQQQ